MMAAQTQLGPTAISWLNYGNLFLDDRPTLGLMVKGQRVQFNAALRKALAELNGRPRLIRDWGDHTPVFTDRLDGRRLSADHIGRIIRADEPW